MTDRNDDQTIGVKRRRVFRSRWFGVILLLFVPFIGSLYWNQKVSADAEHAQNTLEFRTGEFDKLQQRYLSLREDHAELHKHLRELQHRADGHTFPTFPEAVSGAVREQKGFRPFAGSLNGAFLRHDGSGLHFNESDVWACPGVMKVAEPIKRGHFRQWGFNFGAATHQGVRSVTITLPGSANNSQMDRFLISGYSEVVTAEILPIRPKSRERSWNYCLWVNASGDKRFLIPLGTARPSAEFFVIESHLDERRELIRGDSFKFFSIMKYSEAADSPETVLTLSCKVH